MKWHNEDFGPAMVEALEERRLMSSTLTIDTTSADAPVERPATYSYAYLCRMPQGDGDGALIKYG